MTGEPTYNEYSAYAAVAMLVQGLQGAGSQPTRASLLNGLNKVHNYDADGLLDGHPLRNVHTVSTGGIDNCLFFVKLQGSSYSLVRGAEPLCGSTVSNLSAR